MMIKRKYDEEIKELFRLIASMESPEDCRLLFEDLCTFKEREQMALRVKAARLLLENKTYTQVINETELSSATLSRVSRSVKYGSGYQKFLKSDNGEQK